MPLRSPARATPVVLILAGIIVGGCRAQQKTVEPTIEFTTVPDAVVGGAERLAPIAGRVTGARTGQQIVLFARSGVWWVQPLTAEPFTKVEPDSTWKNRIHLGTEYAALLVEPGYRPPDTTEALPRPGGHRLHPGASG